LIISAEGKLVFTSRRSFASDSRLRGVSSIEMRVIDRSDPSGSLFAMALKRAGVDATAQYSSPQMCIKMPASGSGVKLAVAWLK
jgi:hypothetical protein